MITTAEEYLQELWRLKDGNTPSVAILLPKDEEIYEIDLNKRTVKAPPFLSVTDDHTAETVYFICDRYHDNMDLANTVCVVQYINAEGKGRLYGVPFLDVTTFSGQDENKRYIKAYVLPSNYEKNKYYIKNEQGTYDISQDAFDSKAEYYSYVDEPKILFPWVIEGGATAAAGIVQYAIEFYMLDSTGTKKIYSLNTKPTRSEVLQGMNVQDTEMDDITSTELRDIYARLNRLETDWDLYWIEA